MKKVIYIDTETTGLDHNEHGLTEIACIVEYDSKVVDKLALRINPFSYNKKIKATKEAMEKTNKTKKEIKGYPDSQKQFNVFVAFLNRHINPFDKEDKLHVAGYNCQFDMKFIQAWFEDNGHDYCWSYFKGDLDVLRLVWHLVHCDLIHTENHQLGTMCEHYKIRHDAHNALSDIKATRKLHKLLIKKFIKVK